MMNKLSWRPALLAGLLLAGMSGISVADRGHGRYGGHADIGVGIVVNPFWYDSWYYPRPYYYSPYYYPPYYYPAPATPPVYIEREGDEDGEEGPAPEASAYWYYCADPQGYYPYVEQCPGGWQAVAPQPPGEER
jgi:hypothetical protein